MTNKKSHIRVAFFMACFFLRRSIIRSRTQLIVGYIHTRLTVINCAPNESQRRKSEPTASGLDAPGNGTFAPYVIEGPPVHSHSIINRPSKPAWLKDLAVIDIGLYRRFYRQKRISFAGAGDGAILEEATFSKPSSIR
ncbi:hypothetical protein [Acidovorax sp. SUPP1855]|uniref:hypothetical protein n=1 Tax=Acidovorax sp. SUPP1855 TaxID=431774 RepID=UPI0024E04209|nr:hypothetical protein [Acidovorax sp. SUPP1855]